MREKKRAEKIVLWLLIVITLLFVGPLLALSMYDHPSADDYWYAAAAYQAWCKTHNLWNVIKAAFETSADFFSHWQGLYTSAVLLALEPGIFGEQYYAWTGVLLLGVLYAGNLRLCYVVFHKRLGCGRLESMAFGCLLTFLMIQWMPSLRQGIYWFNGAVNYTFFYSLWMFLLAAVLNLYQPKTKVRQVGNFLVAVVLGVLLMGGNHVTAFAGLLSMLVSAGLGFAGKKRLAAAENLLLFFCMLAGFVINITSPGTRTRQAAFTDTPGVLKTIWYAVKAGLGACNSWSGIALLGGIVVSCPFILRMTGRLVKEKKFLFPCPLAVVVGSTGFVCALLCPPLYAMGTTGDGRLINIVYFTFVAAVFLNEIYLCGYLCRKMQLLEFPEKIVTKNYLAVSIIMVLVVLAGCGESMGAYQAALLLKSGEAERYGQEAFARYEILKESEGGEVELEPFSAQPYLLYPDDITEDEKDWRNDYMRQYFRLKSVKLKSGS